MGGWVYRRPFTRTRRRFVPLTRGHGLLVAAFVNRRRPQGRRRVYLRRRHALVLTRGHGLVIGAPRRVGARRRATWRTQRAAIVGGRAATVQHIAAMLRARVPRARRQPRRPQRPPSAPPGFQQPYVPGLSGAVVRFRKAVVRIRRALHARLRWRPHPPVPLPDIERVEQTPKLRVFRPGMYRGLVHGEGVSG